MTPLDAATLGGDRWQRLATRLFSVLSEEAPGWTDLPGSDPGVVLVELFAFLGEQLTFRANALRAPTRARLFDVAARLESLRGNVDATTVRVYVDGEEWRQADALANAGPGDRLFILSDDGRIEFGDGKHGSVPPEGAQVFASYRAGAGEAGNARVSITTHWPPTPSVYSVALAREPGIRITVGGQSTAERSGV